jgi:hypothetical protein
VISVKLYCTSAADLDQIWCAYILGKTLPVSLKETPFEVELEKSLTPIGLKGKKPEVRL